MDVNHYRPVVDTLLYMAAHKPTSAQAPYILQSRFMRLFIAMYPSNVRIRANGTDKRFEAVENR